MGTDSKAINEDELLETDEEKMQRNKSSSMSIACCSFPFVAELGFVLASTLHFEFILKVLDLQGQTITGQKPKEIIIGRCCPNDESQDQLYSVCCSVNCSH